MASRFAAIRERFQAPVQELLGRLSRSQRISLTVLGVVIFIGISLLVFTVPSEGAMVALGPVDQNPELMALLDERGIRYDIDARNQLRVPSGKLGELRQLGVQEMLDNPEEDPFQWLFDQAGWQETSGRRRERLLHTRRIALERSLASTTHIKRARIHINKPPSDDWTFRSNRQQATAAVVLEPEEDRELTAKQALVVAKVVSGAFAIPQSQVQVTDGVKSFDLSDPSSLFEGDRYNREKVIEEKVRSIYSDYSMADLRVSVNLTVSRETRSSHVTRYDQENSFSQPEHRMTEKSETTHPHDQDPGTGRNVRSDLNRGTVGLARASHTRYEREEERLMPALSREEISTQFPAYQEKGTSILVYFSRPAIVERLRVGTPGDDETAEQPSAEDVQRYLDKQQRNIEVLFAGDPAVTTSVVVDSFLPAPSPFVGIEDARGVVPFLADHFRELLLAVLAIVACFLIYRVALANVPEIEELPDPVADLQRFLSEREQELERRQQQASTEAEQEKDRWEVAPEDQRSMELLDSVVGFVREKPEVTAAVLRLWIHDEKEQGQ